MTVSKSMKGTGPAVPHLASKPGGWQGEIWDLRNDVDGSFKKLETGGITTEEWLAPPTASLIYFVPVTAFTAAAQHVHSAALPLVAPRNLVLDVIIGAGVAAGDITVHYLDVEGQQKSVVVPMPAATSTVDLLVAATKVLDLELPACVLPLAGSASVGFGDAIGLKHSVKTRTGVGAHVLEELEDGAPAAVAGTFVTEILSPDYGTYIPNTAPNGAHNYVLVYERG